jgi:decaprenyl-phosphate phosphoribosyltransferase
MAAWHLFRLLRPKQWVKNFFVFAPLLFAGQFSNAASWLAAVWTFIYFCLAASCVYILNDLSDIEADRSHPIKSVTRPLASGHVSFRVAVVTLFVGLLGLVTGFLVVPLAMLPICGYIAINAAYSLFARKVPVLDIFTIAFGFVLRVVAGALAIVQPLSAWMFVTTLCLALYLAAMKRRHELKQLGSTSRSSLETYTVVKVMLVYTIPIVAFGLFRYWFIAERLKSAESPTEAMLKDLPLVGAVVLWVAVCGGVLLFAGQ